MLPSYLPSQLTLVLTTSPSPHHPSTHLLTTVLESLLPSTQLASCDLIVTFDGYNTPLHHTPNLKQGRLNTELAETYGTYVHDAKRWLSTRWASHNKRQDTTYTIQNDIVTISTGATTTATVHTTLLTSPQHTPLTLIQASTHLGFALSIRTALAYVKTPYMMVLQHDWAFTAPIPVQDIIQTMETNPEINYVGFISPRIVEYARKKGQGKGLPSSIIHEKSYKVPLARLFFWFDKNHIASTEYYRTRVFTKGYFQRGDFIEDTFGHVQLNDIKQRGLEGHADYGTYLYYPDQGRVKCLLHLNGRIKMLDKEGKQKEIEMGQDKRRTRSARDPGDEQEIDWDDDRWEL
ncbi:uncharacterized protein SPPG_09384 [Spizellomyces punctatus DAOM BR117]|uniref:Uncharacterized protein n=1 Tax=Spizellomyces punctatus (strain DAOM BR117) TaxID=645134 RepID=A0A0L0HA94_SPIPD|nr:uncharacterized protein SPPG_09384 [Spizellomyces punctatus DAOM BR117]KNC98067.1 hypothetical protein SPPG_09384 [Spizellomyces punctatus DAOM BR117]|eukprot:XP_016606107.1 hypothetical protein SPPG_09384 [Spizellomyces punctatus DAOM BR117]